MLDTDAYAALGRGHPTVASIVRRASGIAFSTVVAGELLGGCRAGGRFERNAAELDEFLRQPVVRLIPVRLSTADRYARIFAALRKKGSPIPTNDLWIAAQAMDTGAHLVSFDAHFASVDGLAWTRIVD